MKSSSAGAAWAWAKGGLVKWMGWERECGARQPSLCGYERTTAPRLFQESSTRLGCYQRTQWKKFVTTS